MIFGAAITPHTADRWQAATKKLGPLHMARGFSSKFPATWDDGAQEWEWHPAVGVTGFISIKPDPVLAANGELDEEFHTFGKSCPDGTHITVWHEPENDDPLQDGKFIRVMQRAYQGLKAGNRNLQVGYVGMAYQWEPGHDSTADPAMWTPVKEVVDFCGVDVYSHKWYADTTLYDHPGMVRWMTHFGDHPVKMVVERGVSQYATNGRVASIKKDLEFCEANGIDGYLYWNADADAGRTEVWALDDDPEACEVMTAAACLGDLP